MGQDFQTFQHQGLGFMVRVWFGFSVTTVTSVRANFRVGVSVRF